VVSLSIFLNKRFATKGFFVRERVTVNYYYFFYLCS